MPISVKGITAPKGFVAGGIHCGIRKNSEKLDLGLVYSEVPCAAAGIYTQNLVKGAPILISQLHLKDQTAQAIIVNSGIANTCAPDGMLLAEKMCETAAQALVLSPEDVLVASTGVIGMPIPIEKVENSVPALAKSLSQENGHHLAEAIMTTDTISKEVAAHFTIDGKDCTIGGVAKGSGMIHPNMATMLSFLTTDAAVSAEALEKALKDTAVTTYNQVSVDGDTSTNDTVFLLANGMAENPPIEIGTEAYEIFINALHSVCRTLSKMLAKDGEGATKLVECTVSEADTSENAQKLARSVISSDLVKAAMFGEDANWGRILCALGYAGVPFSPEKVDVSFVSENGTILVCQAGVGLSFDETLAKTVLSADTVQILVSLHDGEASGEAFGCDLSYDYVKINGDYRS